MKSNIHLITLLLICISSCESDDLVYQNKFEKSRKAWFDFKELANNSYRYTVTSGTWTGSSWETTIEVSGGEITQRHFKYTVIDGLPDNISQEDLEWTEGENEIGVHGYGTAAKPMTLDEVYTKAQRDWLVKREKAEIYFETENDGLISTCGYVDKNCLDDCFVGIKIRSIETL